MHSASFTTNTNTDPWTPPRPYSPSPQKSTNYTTHILNFCNGITLATKNLRKMQTTFSISSTIYDTNTHAHDHFHFLPSDVPFSTTTSPPPPPPLPPPPPPPPPPHPPTTAWYVHNDNHFQTHFIIYKYFNYLPHTQISYISGWCHHIQNISTCNSAQIILSILHILTKI